MGLFRSIIVLCGIMSYIRLVGSKPYALVRLRIVALCCCGSHIKNIGNDAKMVSIIHETFLIALFGAMLEMLLKAKDRILYYFLNLSNTVNFLVCLFWGLSILTFLILVYIGIKSNQYHRYEFEERNLNYSAAVDDKDIFYVSILEGITNCWENNNKFDGRLYWCFNASLIVFGLFTILSIVLMFF